MLVAVVGAAQAQSMRGATTGPAVVGRTLYVVSSDGRLHAYR